MNASDLANRIGFDDVRAAARRLDGVAHRTPVMVSRTLDERCGCQLFLKCENFQRMGAFKFRGAYNAMSQLSEGQRRRGVIAFSSGNHAQAIALSGQLLGVPATIVMPADAPRVKVAATRGYGAEVVLYTASQQREVVAAEIQAKRALTLIPPFDHPHVVAGQGTAAKELFEEVGPLDALLTPCGGGGLLSGSALSARALSPNCKLYGVEPEAGDDGARSFESGRLQFLEAPPDTIADGARTLSLGPLTLALIRQHADRMLTVSDEELITTLRFLWERMKLVVEPTAALGLAPVFHGRLDLQGKRVGVILSGGNADVAEVGRLFV